MKKITGRRIRALSLAAVMSAGCAGLLPQGMMTAYAAGAVVVNEICTKNTTLAAPDGQFYDFIELYNPGSSAVSVAGWGLSDDETKPYDYTLPAGTSVPAKGYLVVYCGVAADFTGQYGANFGLAKKGETVFLTDASGQTLERIEIPALDDNTSYGRIPDGSDVFAVLSEMTAGKANPQSAAVKITVDKPQFSQGSGFYDSGFSLTLAAKSGETIYYTTDGSDPTTASAKYSGAIPIKDPAGTENVYAAKTGIADTYTPPKDPVDKAVVVRAIAVDADGNISKIATNTYFIGYGSDTLAKKMRVISLVTDPDNLFDYEKGIYVKGKIGEQSGGQWNPMGGKSEANYTQSGREWERPANITVFEKGKATYNVDVGIRIHGAYTRSCAQKSFNLYARSDYGAAKMEYDFFNGQLTNYKGKVIDSFDKITLRNGGNDEKTKVRDRLNQELIPNAAFGTQAQTECIVFLDGEFWGCYNVVEKIGKEYVADHYKVKEDDVCFIKTDELADGTDEGWQSYEALKRLVTETDFTKASAYDAFAKLIDMDSMAQYFAAQMIIGNTDFGGNNYALWKTETVDTSKEYADGKWRFILFDTELGQGLYGSSNADTNVFQTLNQLANKGEWLPKLLLGLLKTDNEFSRKFLAAAFDQLNYNFSSEKALARLNELSAIYKAPVAETLIRFSWVGSSSGWGNWGDFQWPGMPGQPGQQPGQPGQPGEQQEEDLTEKANQSFEKEMSTLQTYWTNRASRMRNQLTQLFGSDRVSQQTVTVTVQSDRPVKFNSLDLPAGTYTGTYPSNLLMSAEAGSGLIEWNIQGAELENSSKSDAYVSFLPSGSTVTVKPVFGEAGTLTKADVQKLQKYLLTAGTLTTDEAAAYDLNGDSKLNAKDLSLLKAKVMKK